MTTRRLLAINNYFYRRGGAETVFLDHIDMFAAAGWDVVPFAMQHPENFPSDWSSYFVSEIEYGRQPGLATKLKHAAEVIYSREAKRKLGDLIAKARPNVAHAHNVYHHISPSIFPVLKAAGVPTVMTVHDLKVACPAYKMLSNDGVVCEKCKGGRIHNVVVNRCMKASLALSTVVLFETLVHRSLGLYRNNLDRLVVPSRFYRAKLVEWGWPEEQLAYIPNFVEPPAMETPVPEGDYILFAGRLAPEKGLDTLIRAAALARHPLVIAGTGPEEARLKTVAAQSGAAIQFTGYLTGDALKARIAGAKALVLPSEWYENAPVSLLEAYGLNRPVIGSRIGGIPELIRDGETGMTAEAGNAEDLAKVITRMAEKTPADRLAMGQEGQAWLRRDFSVARYRERTEALYTSLM